MDIFEVIRERRSIRAFTGEDVPDEIINTVIKMATYAPSAGNLQPWEFIVIRDNETKRKLAKAAYNQGFIAKAPVVIVVCANIPRTSRIYGERGKTLYVIQDTAAAIQNMLLAIHALGYGACWVGAFNEEKVRDLLQIPSHVRPLAIISIGRPKYKPKIPQRIPPEEITFYERYGNKRSFS